MRPTLLTQDLPNNQRPTSSSEEFEPSQTVGYVDAIASGGEMQTAAHSTGLLFEQSVRQQNEDFVRNFSCFSESVMRFFNGSNNLKGTNLSLKNELAQTIMKYHPETQSLYLYPKEHTLTH